mgnify:CR=1 FL=1
MSRAPACRRGLAAEQQHRGGPSARQASSGSGSAKAAEEHLAPTLGISHRVPGAAVAGVHRRPGCRAPDQ